MQTLLMQINTGDFIDMFPATYHSNHLTFTIPHRHVTCHSQFPGSEHYKGTDQTQHLALPNLSPTASKKKSNNSVYLKDSKFYERLTIYDPGSGCSKSQLKYN